MSRTSPDSGPLLPCPFCGGEAVQNNEPLYFTVGCDNDGCSMNPSISLSVKIKGCREQVIGGWNTRGHAPCQQQPVAWRWRSIFNEDHWTLGDKEPTHHAQYIVEPLYTDASTGSEG